MTESPEQKRYRQDREANEFAMALLMPEQMVRRDAENIDLCDDDKIKTLAKKYGVPVTLMAIRIGQLMGKRL